MSYVDIGLVHLHGGSSGSNAVMANLLSLGRRRKAVEQEWTLG